MLDLNHLINNPEFNYAWILQQRATDTPDKVAFIYLIDGESEQKVITYSELDFIAKKIAGALQSNGAYGERVLLLYPSSIDYITAFFGCLYAGTICVPLYQLRNNSKALLRMHCICKDATAKFILSTEENITPFKENLEINRLFSNAIWLSTDKITESYVNLWQQPKYQEIAYLQYTSGSTGNPKGVMVSHQNLAHNSRITQLAWKNNELDTIVSWLPLHHDMGLIAMILQTIYSGSLCVFMSPVNFIKNPLNWLRAISNFKATISGAPNFAYDLCIEKISHEQLIELDLSSWKIAYNAAEPVKAKTIDKFSSKFAATGFEKQSFYPYYGMAEITLFTTGNTKRELPVYISISAKQMEQGIVEEVSFDNDNFRTIVACGSALYDQKVIIVDPVNHLKINENQIGEIWLTGPSKALGYWNKPKETIETFAATLKDNSKTEYLRSGDLGFIKDGRLYIVGRLKDLIIIRGKNYYPVDIEVCSEYCANELQINESAAFSVDVSGTEQLVLVQAVKDSEIQNLNRDLIKGLIRRALINEHEINPYDIMLVRSGQIPKTSSGKIQRSLCKKLYLNKCLEVI